MDWTQTLTLMVTIIGTYIGCTYTFFNVIKKDIERHDAEFASTRQEIAKRDALWADLLKEIHEIKLFQATKQ